MLLYITQKATRLSHISAIPLFTEICERIKAKYKRAQVSQVRNTANRACEGEVNMDIQNKIRKFGKLY